MLASCDQRLTIIQRRQPRSVRPCDRDGETSRPRDFYGNTGASPGCDEFVDDPPDRKASFRIAIREQSGVVSGPQHAAR